VKQNETKRNKNNNEIGEIWHTSGKNVQQRNVKTSEMGTEVMIE
jgi:hypothetical protein